MSDLHPRAGKTADDDEIVPTYNRVQAIRDIKDAILCPISWAEVFRIDGEVWFEPLEKLWMETVQNHVRGGGEYVGAQCLLFELDTEEDDELKRMFGNAQLWRDVARAEFRAKVRRFTHLRYASRAEYSKHLLPLGASLSPDQIDAEARKRGVSLFYKNIPSEGALSGFLNALFWNFSDDLNAVEQKLWDRLMHQDNARICFRCTGLIGSSKGGPTEYICFELDATTPIVHAYPVSEAEALQINDGHIQAISDLEHREVH